MEDRGGLSRRDFFKMTLISALSAVLSACGVRVSPPDAAPSLTLTPTNTTTPLPPTANETATSTATPSATSTATALACLHLLAPGNGAKLGSLGKVTFSWEPMPGAATYRLDIILPSGQIASFNTTGQQRDQYLEAFKTAGTYQWQVSALSPAGAMLCTSEPFRFEKQATGKKSEGGSPDSSSADGSSGITSSWSDGGPG